MRTSSKRSQQKEMEGPPEAEAEEDHKWPAGGGPFWNHKGMQLEETTRGIHKDTKEANSCHGQGKPKRNYTHASKKKEKKKWKKMRKKKKTTFPILFFPSPSLEGPM